MSFRILPQLTCWSLLFIGLPLHTAGQDLEGISCATAPGVDARAEFVVEHNGGLVYFCNQSSANQFSADPGSHAASANYQMVRTGSRVFLAIKCFPLHFGISRALPIWVN